MVARGEGAAPSEAVLDELEEEFLDIDVTAILARAEQSRNVDYSKTPSYRYINPSQFAEYANGERSLEELPFYVDELTQIRTTYNPEGLYDLADSLERGTTPPYIWQVNPIQINEFDNQAALRAYIADYKLFYGIKEEIDISSLHQRPDGTWRILIAGHRRNRALRIVADRHDYVLKDGDVKKDVYKNMPFADAIAMQGRENEHMRVNPEDAAEDIYRHLEFYMRKNKGKKPTHKMLSHITGYSVKTISQGLRYHALPPEIKREYKNGMFSYPDVIKLGELLGVTKKYLLHKYPDEYGHGVELFDASEELEADTLNSVLAFVAHLKSEALDGASAKRRTEVIDNKIGSLIVSIRNMQDAFDLEIVDAKPAERRKKADAKLGKQATQIVLDRVMHNPNELTDAEVQNLRAIKALVDGWEQAEAVREAEAAVERAYKKAQAIF